MWDKKAALTYNYWYYMQDLKTLTVWLKFILCISPQNISKHKQNILDALAWLLTTIISKDNIKLAPLLGRQRIEAKSSWDNDFSPFPLRWIKNKDISKNLSPSDSIDSNWLLLSTLDLDLNLIFSTLYQIQKDSLGKPNWR